GMARCSVAARVPWPDTRGIRRTIAPRGRGSAARVYQGGVAGCGMSPRRASMHSRQARALGPYAGERACQRFQLPRASPRRTVTQIRGSQLRPPPTFEAALEADQLASAEPVGDRAILRGRNEHRYRRFAVTPAPADLLVVAIDVLRDASVYNGAQVGLINAK